MKIAVEDRTGVKIAMPVVDALRRAILDNRIDFMIVEPFVSSRAVNEKDNTRAFSYRRRNLGPKSTLRDGNVLG